MTHFATLLTVIVALLCLGASALERPVEEDPMIQKRRKFKSKAHFKKYTIRFRSKKENVKKVTAKNPCVRRLPMEGGELQFDFFNGKAYKMKSVDVIDGRPAIYMQSGGSNVFSTHCVDGAKNERNTLVCDILNSKKCEYNNKASYNFAVIAKSTDGETKKMCVNICLKCPKGTQCEGNARRYNTNIIEMDQGTEECDNVCDKENLIDFANKPIGSGSGSGSDQDDDDDQDDDEGSGSGSDQDDDEGSGSGSDQDDDDDQDDDKKLSVENKMLRVENKKLRVENEKLRSNTNVQKRRRRLLQSGDEGC